MSDMTMDWIIIPENLLIFFLNSRIKVGNIRTIRQTFLFFPWILLLFGRKVSFLPLILNIVMIPLDLVLKVYHSIDKILPNKHNNTPLHLCLHTVEPILNLCNHNRNRFNIALTRRNNSLLEVVVFCYCE